MQMVFTNAFPGVPILFDTWAPTSVNEFVGSVFAIALIGFIFRTLLFLRSFLNHEYWSTVATISTF